MPVTCDAWPSTCATYSCSSRSPSSRGLTGVTRLLEQMPVQPPHAFLERDRRCESEAIAHGAIGGAELDVLRGLPFVPDRGVDAEHVPHRTDDFIDGDRRAGGDIDG